MSWTETKEKSERRDWEKKNEMWMRNERRNKEKNKTRKEEKEGGDGVKGRAIKLWQQQPYWLSWRRPWKAGRARSPGNEQYTPPSPTPTLFTSLRPDSVSIHSPSSPSSSPHFPSPSLATSQYCPSSFLLHHSLTSHCNFPLLVSLLPSFSQFDPLPHCSSDNFRLELVPHFYFLLPTV